MSVTVKHRFDSHSVKLSRPAYTALGRGLAAAAYDAFSDLAITPENIYFDGGRQPSEYQMSCELRPHGWLRFRLTNVELVVSSEKGYPFAPPDVVERALAIYRTADERIQVREQTISLAAHVQLETGTAEEILARFISAGPAGGRLRPSSISFSSGIGTHRGSVDVQPSLVFADPGAVFVRFGCDVAGNVTATEAHRITTEFANESAPLLGIALRWPE